MYQQQPAKRRAIDSKKHFAGLVDPSQHYPHRMNFYSNPPIAEITLDQFEQWAIDRLRSSFSLNTSTPHSVSSSPANADTMQSWAKLSHVSTATSLRKSSRLPSTLFLTNSSRSLRTRRNRQRSRKSGRKTITATSFFALLLRARRICERGSRARRAYSSNCGLLGMIRGRSRRFWTL